GHLENFIWAAVTAPFFYDYSRHSRFFDMAPLRASINDWGSNREGVIIMSNAPKLLSKFRISDSDLLSNDAMSQAFSAYSGRRDKFCEAKKELGEAIQEFRNVLDGPLRLQG